MFTSHRRWRAPWRSSRSNAARDQALKRLDEGRSKLEDAKKGKRPQEIDAIEAQLNQSRAALVLSEKIIPYIVVGYIQVAVILVASHFLFHVPMHGSISLLLVCALVFIAANLAMGITFSTIAKNQLQAMQRTFFVFLPSILLSGFMFPFRGMPQWAQ